jgi:hypothetical protein
MAKVRGNTVKEGAFDCRTMPYHYLDVFLQKEEWLQENCWQMYPCNAQPSLSGWRGLMWAIGSCNHPEASEVGLFGVLGRGQLRYLLSEAMLVVNFM